MKKITLNELEFIFKLLLKYIKQQNIKAISFSNEDNYYFKVWHQDRNFDDLKFLKCPKYTIGSLSDDIEELRKILANEDEVSALDIERLGAILTALGATIVKKMDR